MPRTLHIVLCLLVFSFLIGIPDTARAAETSSVATTALYEGPDREHRLLAQARKEGAVLLYTSLTVADLKDVTAGFEKKYGIKVNTWRGSSSDVVQRVMTEATANRFDFDALHLATPELEALRRENLLQAAKSPHTKDLIQATLPAHREWASTCFNVYAQGYNTTKVKKEEVPKTYQDLLNPRWKGRLGIEATTNEWFYNLVREMGQEKGLKFFRDLVAINNPSQRIGHTVLNNLVVAGEVPFALNVYHFAVEKSKQQGAPVDWLTLEPTYAIGYGVTLSKKAPHPAAAMLLYDYMITDAQTLMITNQYRVPANRKYASPFKNIKMKVLDPVLSVNEQEKSSKLYEDILAGK